MLFKRACVCVCVCLCACSRPQRCGLQEQAALVLKENQVLLDQLEAQQKRSQSSHHQHQTEGTHTYTHTHTHARTGRRTHTHTHTHTLWHTQAHSDTQVLSVKGINQLGFRNKVNKAQLTAYGAYILYIGYYTRLCILK